MSGDRFTRRCKRHPDREVVDVERGRSVVVICETGHSVDKWLVFDAELGHSVDTAQLNGGLLVLPALVPSAGHRTPCKNGHTDRWRRRSDKGQGRAGWVCGACHYAASRRYLARLEARG